MYPPPPGSVTLSGHLHFDIIRAAFVTNEWRTCELPGCDVLVHTGTPLAMAQKGPRAKRFCSTTHTHRAAAMRQRARLRANQFTCSGCGATWPKESGSRSRCVWWCGSATPVPDSHPSRSSAVPPSHPSRRGRCAHCCGDYLAVRTANLTVRYCSPRCGRAAQAVNRSRRARAAFVERVEIGELLIRDGGLCGLCGDLITPITHGPLRVSLDHVIPLSLGGTHERANAQPAHQWCNNGKGNRIALVDVARRLQLERHYSG